MISIAENIDCIEAMKTFPDKFFDLAIVDPEYKDGTNENLNVGKNRNFQINFSGKPKQEYFNELFRTSRNQIIWGGNYFTDFLYQSDVWICWDKVQHLETFSGFELAWTSYKERVNLIFRYCNKYIFGVRERKIHPTQKPVTLYKWLLQNYAKPGWKILDTHLGSGSSRIAAYDLNFDFCGYELDKHYFDLQEKRFKQHISQQRLFTQEMKSEQMELIQ